MTTLLEFVLLLAAINLAAFVAVLLRRGLARERDVERLQEYRIGLAYVADGQSFPDDRAFAAALIHGHDATLRRRFPSYPTFRAAELERLENDDE